jgi:hypothetical protein
MNVVIADDYQNCVASSTVFPCLMACSSVRPKAVYMGKSGFALR